MLSEINYIEIMTFSRNLSLMSSITFATHEILLACSNQRRVVLVGRLARMKRKRNAYKILV
jgi:hypothetical protein